MLHDLFMNIPTLTFLKRLSQLKCPFATPVLTLLKTCTLSLVYKLLFINYCNFNFFQISAIKSVHHSLRVYRRSSQEKKVQKPPRPIHEVQKFGARVASFVSPRIPPWMNLEKKSSRRPLDPFTNWNSRGLIRPLFRWVWQKQHVR